MKHCEYIVIGHRNPDIDSLAAACALAYLREKTDKLSVKPMASSLPGPRAEYLFKRFRYPLPEIRRDVYPCVNDIIDNAPPVIHTGKPLFSAIKLLEKHHLSRLAVLDEATGKYAGMLSLFSMLGELMQSGRDDGKSFTGRRMRASLELIREVLDGEFLSLHDGGKIQDFEVYVAAMNVESFREHIPRGRPRELAIVVGDRSDIHLLSIGLRARLMIVTGSREVDSVVLAAARAKKVSILKTALDSATVVRRLKFSSPVALLMQKESLMLARADRLTDIRKKVFGSREDIFPVVDENGKFQGILNKIDISGRAPHKVLMVDHSDFDNSIPGIEELCLHEIVDHHRFSLPPVDYPVKITCDTVGSSCTLVTELFQNARVKIPPDLAGIMLGGIITDTLLLRSPTTTERDKKALSFLEKIAKVTAAALHMEIFRIGSLIAQMPPEDALKADKKNFNTGRFNFAVSQVEEASFEEYYAKEKELMEAARKLCAEESLNALALLITDVVRENSLLMIVGDSKLIWSLSYRKIHDGLYDLPGVLSRKKQLLPELLKNFGSV